MAEDLNNESQFTEMLRIEFDVADFQQQLNLLAQTYQDFLAKLSEMEGPQPLANAAAGIAENTDAQLAQIQEGLTRTLVAVEGLSEKVIDAITIGFEGLLEKVKSADNTISADTKKTAEAVGGSFKEQIDALKAQLQTLGSEQDAANIKLAQAYAKDEDIWRTVLANKQRFFEEYQARLTQIQEQAAQVRTRLHEAESTLRSRTAETGPNAIGGRELRSRELQITALQEEAKAKEALERETEENLDRLRADNNNRQLAREKGLAQSLGELNKQQFAAIVGSQLEAEKAAERAANASIVANRRTNEAIIAAERAKIQQFETGNQQMLQNEEKVLTQLQTGSKEYFAQLSTQQQEWIVKHAELLARSENVQREVWAEAVQLAQQANQRILEIEKQRVDATTALAEREKNVYATVQYRGESRAPETGEVNARQNEIAALRGQVAAYEAQLKELRGIAAQTEGGITADKLAELEKRLVAVNKEVASEIASAQTAADRRVNIEEAANQRFMAQLSATAREKLRFKEQLVQAEQLAQQKITEYREAAAAAQRRLDERTGSFSFSEQQVNATKRMVAAYQDAITKIEALFRQLQEVGAQAANNVDNAFTESNAKLVSTFEGSVNRVQAGLDRVISTEQRGGEAQGFFGRIKAAVSSLPGDLAETAVSLTKIMVLWGLIGKAIELVKDAILFLPRALETGIQYLSQMQEKAVELQAVIAQTTHLADGFDENFKAAGVASEQVIEQLRIKAAQLGLDFEKLVVTFKNLSEGGAPSMLHNLQEQVDLTTTLELAMRAVASDQQESRRIQQEIPKLLDGTIDAQSRFLHVTHLTVDEWNDLVKAGMAHGDLLQRVQAQLKEFVEAGKSLPGTWENLVKQVGLFNSMIAGSLAKATFTALSDIMRQVIAYMAQHRAQWEAIVGAVGTFIGNFIRISATLVELIARFPGLTEAVRGIGLLILEWFAALNKAAAGLYFLIELFTHVRDAVLAIPKPDWLVEAATDVSSGWQEVIKYFEKAKDFLVGLKDAVKGFASEVVTFIVNLLKSVPVLGALISLEEKLQQQIAKTGEEADKSLQSEKYAGVRKEISGIAEAWARYTAQVEQGNTAAEEFISNQQQQAKASELAKDTSASPLPVDRGVKEAAELHKQFNEVLKLEKDRYDELRTSIEQDAATRKTSQTQAMAATIKSLEDEKKSVITLSEAYGVKLAESRLDQQTHLEALRNLFVATQTETARLDKEIQAAKTRGNTLAFEEEQANYKEQLKALQTYYDAKLNQVKLAEATHTITAQEAAQKRIKIYQDEHDAILGVLDQAAAKFKSLGVRGADTIFTELKGQIDSANKKLQDEQTSALVAALNEQAQLEKIYYTGRIQRLTDFNKHEQALIKAALQDKLLTETEAINQLISLEEQSYRREREALQKEGGDLALTPQARAQALEKLKLLDQQYTEATVVNAQRRLAAEEKETKEREALAREEAALATRDTQLNIQAAAAEANTAAKRLQQSRLLIDAKLHEAEVNVEIARTELLAAEARGKTNTEIQKLTDNLRKAQQELRGVALSGPSQQSAAGGQTRGSGSAVAEEREIQRNIQKFRELYTVLQLVTQGLEQYRAQILAQITALQNWSNQLKDRLAKNPNDQDAQQAQLVVDQKLKELQGTLSQLDVQIKTNTDTLGQYDQGIKDGQQSLESHKISLDTLTGTIQQMFPILNLYHIWHQKAGEAVVSFTAKLHDSISNIGQTIQQVMGVISAIRSGGQQGGVLGAIGGGLTSIGGMVSAINPLIGGIMQGVGQIFGFIGEMFDKKAKEIMRSIQAQTNETMKELQFGQLGDIQALALLQQQFNEAATQLSGSKRDQMLLQLGDQIRQIEFQMKQTVGAFQQLVQFGRLHSDQLQQFMQTWQQINKQAADYINAGGSVRVAQEYIAQQLKDQQLKAQDEYLQGEQQAIQDALQLNDLYKQAVQLQTQKFNLIKQEKETEFNILTQDSIERRIPQAVQIYNQLTQQRTQFQQQLAQINDQQQSLQYELQIQSEKVAKETQMYGLATDIAGLHRQDEALSNYFLDEQLQKTLALKAIMTGIYVPQGWGNIPGTNQSYELLTEQFKTLTGIGKYFQNDNPYFAFAGDLRNLQILTQEGAAFQQAQQPFLPGAVPTNYNNPYAPYTPPPGAGPLSGDIGLTSAIQSLQLTIAQFNQTLPGNIADAIPSIGQLLANSLTNPFLNVGKSVDNLTQIMTQLEQQIAQWLSTLGKGYALPLVGAGAQTGTIVSPTSTPAISPPTPAPTPAANGTVTTNQLLNAINQVSTAVTTASTTQTINITNQTTQLVSALTKFINQVTGKTPAIVAAQPSPAGQTVPTPTFTTALTNLTNQIQKLGATGSSQSLVSSITEAVRVAFNPRNTRMFSPQYNFGQVVIQNNGQPNGPAMADAFIHALQGRIAIGSHF